MPLGSEQLSRQIVHARNSLVFHYRIEEVSRGGTARRLEAPHHCVGTPQSARESGGTLGNLEFPVPFLLSRNKESPQKAKAPSINRYLGLFQFNPGSDLRSHAVTRAVSSAQRGLTSVFGMGTGVTLAV